MTSVEVNSLSDKQQEGLALGVVYGAALAVLVVLGSPAARAVWLLRNNPENLMGGTLVALVAAFGMLGALYALVALYATVADARHAAVKDLDAEKRFAVGMGVLLASFVAVLGGLFFSSASLFGDVEARFTPSYEQKVVANVWCLSRLSDVAACEARLTERQSSFFRRVPAPPVFVPDAFASLKADGFAWVNRPPRSDYEKRQQAVAAENIALYRAWEADRAGVAAAQAAQTPRTYKDGNGCTVLVQASGEAKIVGGPRGRCT